jgi:hypothetical protein
MYCNYCGKVIPDDANLCAYCGKRVEGVVARERLVRRRQDRKIAGVCAGFAEYFDLVCWIVIPEEPLMLQAPPTAQDQVVKT